MSTPNDNTNNTNNQGLLAFVQRMIDDATQREESVTHREGIAESKFQEGYVRAIRRWAMNLESAVLDLPTMRDMTEQQREGHKWSQAWDGKGNECVITNPVTYSEDDVDTCDCAIVLYNNGLFETLPHGEVVPRPHLEPLTWPSASTHVVNSVDGDEAGTEDDDQVVTELTNVTEVDAVGGPVDGYPSTGWRANTDSHYLGADEKVWWFDGNNWNNGNEMCLSHNLSPEHEPYVVYDPHFEPDGIYLDGEDMNTLWERVDGAWVFGHTERERQEKRGQGLGYVSPPLKHGPYERVSTKQY